MPPPNCAPVSADIKWNLHDCIIISYDCILHVSLSYLVVILRGDSTTTSLLGQACTLPGRRVERSFWSRLQCTYLRHHYCISAFHQRDYKGIFDDLLLPIPCLAWWTESFTRSYGCFLARTAAWGTCANSSPTTYKAASINYKPSNSDNDYSHPLGKSFMILLVELVHIQIACATCARITTTFCMICGTLDKLITYWPHGHILLALHEICTS
jgi:hypothetical protein